MLVLKYYLLLSYFLDLIIMNVSGVPYYNPITLIKRYIFNNL